MKIVCIGGGPSGLYFALLMKQANPAHDITVVERNKAYDTFGWGVVFSDATMDNMRVHDPKTAAEIQQAFNHWDDIELEFKGQRTSVFEKGSLGHTVEIDGRHTPVRRQTTKVHDTRPTQRNQEPDQAIKQPARTTA